MTTSPSGNSLNGTATDENVKSNHGSVTDHRFTTSSSDYQILNDDTVNGVFSKFSSGFSSSEKCAEYLKSDSIAQSSPIEPNASSVVSSKQQQVTTCENNTPPISQSVPQQQKQQQSTTLSSPTLEIGNNSAVVSSSDSSNNTKSSPTYSSSLLGNNNSSNYLTSSTLHSANVNHANRTLLQPSTAAPTTTTFDYLYEFSETRKVLEDFFKCPTNEEEKKIADCFNESDTGSFVRLLNNI